MVAQASRLHGSKLASWKLALQFLGDLFELVALDDVADLIFAEVAQLDTAFESNPHFLHVILETAQGGESAIVNRLATAQDARPLGASTRKSSR